MTATTGNPFGFDCAYRPFPDVAAWVKSFSPSSALVIGRDSDELAAMIQAAGVTEGRAVDAAGARRRLHDGVYVFMDAGQWHSLWVTHAKPQADASQARLLHSDDHLGEALWAWRDHWDQATPLLGDSPVHAGSYVRPRSRAGWGVVRRIYRTEDGHRAAVELGNRLEVFDVEDLEVLDGDLRDPAFWVTQGAVGSQQIAQTLSWIKLDSPLTDTLYSFAATKTTFKPYQFIPVLKMLNSSTGRLLIADEVGLGKTIEAGLIWTEIEQRQPVRRALVVAPASLILKWRQEMEQRFMRPLKELTTTDLREFISDLRADLDPELIGVISLQRLRSAVDELAELVTLNPVFDLIIVDEAHALRNQQSRSYHLGTVLADIADHLVFLSATPLNLGTNDLFNLVNLLDEGTFPDSSIFQGQLEPNRYLNQVARIMADPARRSSGEALVALAQVKRSEQGAALALRPDFERLEAMLKADSPPNQDDVARIKRYVSELNTLGSVFTRTRKIDVPDRKALRVVEEVLVEWSDDEHALYTSIYQHAMGRALQTNMPLGFALQMPLRQACSSLVVAQRRQIERRGWRLTPEDDAIDEGEVVNSGDEPEDQELTSAILRYRLNHDTKLDALKTRLRRARQQGMKQALIFSFFRGTVDYLAHELSDEGSTQVLHGGVPMANRQAILDKFRSGEIDVLIANQVGSEGLDFEFCNVLVNYDLPWNPMEVEQRIGRLDRFGQKHEKLFIFNMKTPGTIESDIYGRLYARIGVFEDSIGDLEPIMRGGLAELNRNILDPRLSDDEKKKEIDRFLVATANERDQVRELENASGVLTSLALLDVEGLSNEGPTNGRYVGAAELQMLLESLLVETGGTLRATSSDLVFTIHGSDELGSALRKLRVTTSGTMHGIGKLGSLIRDGNPITATFDPHYEGVGAIELITARHPLIRLAVERLRERRDHLPRFGAVGVPGINPTTTALVSIDLVRATGGVRDTQELWITAVDRNTGALIPDMPDAIMTALAEGALQPATVQFETGATKAQLLQIQALVSLRQANEKAERTQENDALVSARVASEQRSVRNRLDRVSAQLQRTRGHESDPRILRMLEGQVRNRQAEIGEIEEKYRLKRRIVLSVEHVAVLLAKGAA